MKRSIIIDYYNVCTDEDLFANKPNFNLLEESLQQVVTITVNNMF